MLSEHERDQAIKEGARNAADSAYFNGRPHLADDTGIRVFDAGFDRGWDAATAPLLARIAELDRSLEVMAKNTEAQAHASLQREIELTEKVEKMTRELEEARRKAQEDSYEFNRAINFAIDQGSEACHFLSAWREGDPSGWPEFNAAIKEQT